MRILIVQGHPDPQPDHFDHAIATAYMVGARASSHVIETMSLAAMSLPFVRCRDELQANPPDVIANAQAQIRSADHLVMIFPIWNGSSPALVRGFFEQVFRPRFMFPDMEPGEKLGFFSALRQRKGLTGKSGRVIVTMAMPALLYRFYFRPHPEFNTLRLAGLAPLRQTFIGRIDESSDRHRRNWLDRVTQLGRRGV